MSSPRFVAELDAVRKPLDVAVRGISDAAQATEGRLTALAKELAERHAVQEADYRAILAASEEQGGRTAERAGLQTSLANAQAAAADLLAKQTQRQGLATGRHELLTRASELRDQRFALRKRVAERLTSLVIGTKVDQTNSAVAWSQFPCDNASSSP